MKDYRISTMRIAELEAQVNELKDENDRLKKDRPLVILDTIEVIKKLFIDIDRDTTYPTLAIVKHLDRLILEVKAEYFERMIN
jgi:ribosomal protein L29